MGTSVCMYVDAQYPYGLWKKVVRPPVVLGRDCGGGTGSHSERSLDPTLGDYETEPPRQDEVGKVMGTN